MPAILSNQLQEASYARNVWRAICPHGTSLDDVLKPEYWANVSKQLQELDHIEVVAEDRAWYAELIVLQVGHLAAKVKVINLVRLNDIAPMGDAEAMQRVKVAAKLPEPPAGAEYKVEWKGANKKFTVIRQSDKAAIQDGFASKDEALQWLEGHRVALAA